VVIVPIYKGEVGLGKISEIARKLKQSLEAKGVSVKYDDRDSQRPGWKFAEYEFKGVPLRIAIGERDLQNNTVEVARRDTREKETLQQTDIENKIVHLLQQIQDNLYKKAFDFREQMTHHVDTYDDFKKALDLGGLVYAHWDGSIETEQKIKEETKATIRCIPLNNKQESGKCIYSQKPSIQRVVFARAY
jgi:prolyl-tRNA synthetase